jgi:hypothetical protein
MSVYLCTSELSIGAYVTLQLNPTVIAQWLGSLRASPYTRAGTYLRTGDTYVAEPLHQALDEALERDGAISAMMFRYSRHLRAPSSVASARKCDRRVKHNRIS